MMGQSVCLVWLKALPAILLVGCVIAPPYPEYWAPIVDAKKSCEVIAGSYSNFGRSGDDEKNWHVVNLKLILLPGKAIDIPIDYISLNFRERHILEVKAIYQKQVVAEVEYSVSESTLECYPSSATIQGYRGATQGMGNPLVGVESNSTTLAKAEDGSLVVEKTTSAAGLVYMFLPVAVYGRGWYRFPPL